ncbi:MAG: lipopolysaccharide heptosyltransferase II [Acidiferrobacter sp.]
MKEARALVIGPAWVGDMVMAQSLFQLLKARHPDISLDVIAPPVTSVLLARMPEVAQAIPLAVPHGQFALRQRLKLGWSLRDQHYEQAFVLPRSYKAALPAWTCGARRRTGFLGEGRWGLLNDIRREPKGRRLRTVDRFLLLGIEPDEVPPDAAPPRLLADADCGRAVLARFGLSLQGPILALCPGAEYGPAKRWPAHHFATLATIYRNRGWQVWLLGGARDQEAAATIQSLSHEACADFTGHTSLLDAVDLLGLATAVVSNDSGLMHVAASLGLPLVAVFGSSDPAHTPPLDTRAIAISLHLPCSPCFARTCPLGHLRCLEELLPERVDKALSGALSPRDGELP